MKKQTNTDERWMCIDFGTCNTAAAIEIDGEPQVVQHGTDRHFPTVACVLPPEAGGGIAVCQSAVDLRTVYPENFKQEFKLQIADYLDIEDTDYVDIIREILLYVKHSAELAANDCKIDCVLLTVPALYTENDPRKKVMLEAARKAGFRKVEFITEPEAAAHHYLFATDSDAESLTVVYDLGGGTFDPALLFVDADGTPHLTGYETGVKCGGHFFDSALYKLIAEQARQAEKPLVRSKRLEDYAACRRLKESLSLQATATQMMSNGVMTTVTRKQLDDAIAPMLQLTLQALDNMLVTAGSKWADVTRVLLVGGSTSLPVVSEMLKKHLASHNAVGVDVVRSVKGKKMAYSNLFATCLGGIATKIATPPPPPEAPGTLTVGSVTHTLREGRNTIGRQSDNTIVVGDPALSRHHFVIDATRNPDDGTLSYSLTSVSTSRSTVLGREALDTRYSFARTTAPLAHDSIIMAGGSKFIFRRAEPTT